MKITIGADHRGFDHKEFIKQHLKILNDTIEWIDVGAYNKVRSDYPVFVEKACGSMLIGQAQKGILICGSGVGMAIAANRYPHIYAALVWNEEVARQSKADDNANVVVLPADFISLEQGVSIVESWLHATFKGGRYQERLDMID
jgi:ribose 5-phosphate isomerase B